MQKIDNFDFYRIGKALGPIVEHSGDSTAGEIFFPLFMAGNLLDQLIKGEPVPLGISKASAASASAAISC